MESGASGILSNVLLLSRLLKVRVISQHNHHARRRFKKATNDTCFYHANFRAAARKCQSPCKFSKKPPSQTMIAAAEPGTLPTSRILFIIDLNNRLRFLIDSEAEISLIPPKP